MEKISTKNKIISFLLISIFTFCLPASASSSSVAVAAAAAAASASGSATGSSVAASAASGSDSGSSVAASSASGSDSGSSVAASAASGSGSGSSVAASAASGSGSGSSAAASSASGSGSGSSVAASAASGSGSGSSAAVGSASGSGSSSSVAVGTSAVVSNKSNIPHNSTYRVLLPSSKRNKSSRAKEIFDQSVHFSFRHAKSFLNLLKSHRFYTSMAYSDCEELSVDSVDQLSNVINRNSKLFYTKTDVQTWLSAALTNQETCIETLQNTAFSEGKEQIITTARNLIKQISNSLSIYVSHYEKSVGRELSSESGFPKWVSLPERKLLQTPAAEMQADATVAKDGSGTHGEIMKAIEMAGKNRMDSWSRFVIYIKAGTYHEIIRVPTNVKNVMLIGDGRDKTIIVANRNVDDGWSTFQSATTGIMGDGFMAKGITFINNAGPNKRQAVALRVGSDRSVIYQCAIQGYYNSLHTHSKRQFFRDSDIFGTVDFIFGNSAVVFQNCNIYSRDSVHKNFITAQGRTDPNQNTGISVHNCRISGRSNHSTYLGRPWKKYSRTVIMQSFLDGSINPAGWYQFGNFSHNTSYYSEYMNTGPGSGTLDRVKWVGYHDSLTATEAKTFTVGNFIQGKLWLPATGVGFDSELMG